MGKSSSAGGASGGARKGRGAAKGAEGIARARTPSEHGRAEAGVRSTEGLSPSSRPANSAKLKGLKRAKVKAAPAAGGKTKSQAKKLAQQQRTIAKKKAKKRG